MELAEHFGTIWRRKWRILLATAVVVGLVFAWRNTRPRVYAATSLLSVTPARTTSGGASTKDEVQFLSDTYAALARSRRVVSSALSNGGPKISVSTAIQRISTDTSSTPGFIKMTTTGPTPASARSLGQVESEAVIAEVSGQQKSAKSDDVRDLDIEITALATQLNGLPANSPQRPTLQAQYDALIQARVDSQVRPVDRLDLLAPALAEEGPVSPRPARDAALALVVALVINSELAVLLESLSDRFSVTDDTDDVAELTGLPILARIPRGSDEDTLEEVRTLRAAFMLTNMTLHTVAVVSSEQGSGKSYISRRLAAEMSAMSIPVLLVDGDLRRPTQHAAFGVPRSPGLSDLLQGGSPEEAAHPVADNPNLKVLPAGSQVADPGGLLTSNTLRPALKRVQGSEFVIVDTPASSFFADATAIAAECDVTVLVINAQRSRRRAVRKLVDQLHQAGATPIGVVVNWAEVTTRSSYYYAGQRVPV